MSGPGGGAPDTGARTEVDRESLGLDRSKLHGLPRRELAVRFAFGAAVSVASGLVSLAAGNHAGGALLAFPAMLPAALTLIESRHGTSEATSDVRGAVVGAVGMIAFAATVVALAGRMPVILAVLVAGVAWGVCAAALFVAGTHGGRRLGEQEYLPEIAVVEAEPAVRRLRAAGLTVAVAEVFTGGAVTALLSAAGGASDAVRGGVVAGDRTAGDVLDLPGGLLEERGGVSEEVAQAMAEGVRRRLSADVGLAVTGFAAPGDAGQNGLVIVGAVGPAGTRVARIVGDRGTEADRTDAARAAIRLCGEVVPDPAAERP